MQKYCKGCDQFRDVDDFTKNCRLKDGRSYTCKFCMKQWRDANKESTAVRMSAWRKENREDLSTYRREWKHSNREKFDLMEVGRLEAHYGLVNQIKSKDCCDCHKLFPPFCMDFDHRPGEVKIQSVSRMLGHYSWESILAEIAKCDLVCKNCHIIRTTQRARVFDQPYRFGGPDRQEICVIVDVSRSKPCSDCHKSCVIEVMQFDHVSGVKVDRLSRLKLTGTLQQVRDEIVKCDVVCANCHAIRTNTRDKSKLRGFGYRASARLALGRSTKAPAGAQQEA